MIQGNFRLHLFNFDLAQSVWLCQQLLQAPGSLPGPVAVQTCLQLVFVGPSPLAKPLEYSRDGKHSPTTHSQQGSTFAAGVYKSDCSRCCRLRTYSDAESLTSESETSGWLDLDKPDDIQFEQYQKEFFHLRSKQPEAQFKAHRLDSEIVAALDNILTASLEHLSACPLSIVPGWLRPRSVPRWDSCLCTLSIH